MARRFFGLTPNDKEIFLEHIFSLMYYMGFTYREAYLLPIWQRIWFLERLNTELKRARDGGGDDASRGMHTNSPDARALMGRHNPNAPAKLRRFT